MNIMNRNPLILFLDFDGVINNYLFKADEDIPETLAECTEATKHFDKKALKYLDKMIEAFEKTRDVWIVVSSSWRTDFNIEELRVMCARHNMSKHFYDKTINTETFPRDKINTFCIHPSHLEDNECCRAAEIQAWRSVYPQAEILVLDDIDEEYHLSTNFKENFIKTHPKRLITKGIKNYVITDLYGDLADPVIKQKIEAKQKLRAEMVLNLPVDMPKVMQFYAYTKGVDREETNKIIIEDITSLWTSFLRQQFKYSKSLSDVQIETFKFYYIRYLQYMLKTNNYEEYELGIKFYHAALEHAGILNAYVSKETLKDNNLKAFLKFDKDGIDVNVAFVTVEDENVSSEESYNESIWLIC